MSKGIGGFCKKNSEDSTAVFYEYSSYNLNDLKYKNDERIMDGFIIIRKSALPIPEIHKKIKKLPTGRKLLVLKRFSCDFSVKRLVDEGKILIENCTNVWETDGDYDIIALHLCKNLIHEYQLKEEFPDKQGYHI